MSVDTINQDNDNELNRLSSCLKGEQQKWLARCREQTVDIWLVS